MKTLTAMALMVTVCAPAAANDDWYGTLGVGHAEHFPANREDNYYEQSKGGFDQVTDRQDDAYFIGLGKRINKWSRAEFQWIRPGGVDRYAKFVGPDDNYDPYAEDGCNGDCNPAQSGYVKYRVRRMYALSGLFETPKVIGISFFARLGLEYHVIDFDWFTTGDCDTCMPNPYDKSLTKRGGRGQRGFGPVAGLGIEYGMKNGSLAIEYTNYNDARVKFSPGLRDPGPSDGINMLTLAYRVAF